MYFVEFDRTRRIDHAIQFLDAADRELTGDVLRPWSDDDEEGEWRVTRT